MAIALIIAIVSLPILEILLLIKIGSAIGVLALLAILIAMAIFGAVLLRHQGLAVARRALAQIERNEPPVQSVIDGIGLSLAGLLMLIPGLISDVIGLLLLVPAIRRPLVRYLLGGSFAVWGGRMGAGSAPGARPGGGRSEGSQPRGSPDGVVIEGEFERLEERTVRPANDARRDRPSGDDKSPWRQ